MRTNLPVTTTEYLLAEDVALVSRTDLKSRITYVNPAFVEASGFTSEALMGKAHNIVRHPDMPPEASTDMWRTLDEGVSGRRSPAAVPASQHPVPSAGPRPSTDPVHPTDLIHS